MSKKHIVAVYGTLREGHGNHRILANGNATLVGTYRTDNHRWNMVSLGGFPAVCFGTGNISVEVYEVDDDTLERLDMLEGFPHLYQKAKLTTPYGPATMYIMSPDAVKSAPIIVHGDWNEWLQRGTISIVREPVTEHEVF